MNESGCSLRRPSAYKATLANGRHSRTGTDRPISLDGNDKLPASVFGVLFVAVTVALYALAAWIAWELWQLL
jgi:hypothetical protein